MVGAEEKEENLLVTVLILFTACSNHVCYLVYVLIKRRAARVFYKEKPENSFLIYLQYISCYTINIVIYGAIPFIMALFNNIKSESRFYRVAEKISKPKRIK
jgi:hypothetical protein